MPRKSIFVFENPKTFLDVGIESEPIKKYESILYNTNYSNTCVWIPPPGIEQRFNKGVCEILSKDFNFSVSTSYFMPYYDNILIFGSEGYGISTNLLNYFVKKVKAIPVHIPQTRDLNGRKGKNCNASFNLIHSILMSLMVLRSSFFKSLISNPKKDISFWFPNWSPSGARKGNEMTTRMIGAMSRDIVLSLGEKKIYWDYRSSHGQKGCQNKVAITVSQGLLKKEMMDVTFPSFDSDSIILVDIVIHPSDSDIVWNRFPIINLGNKKKILVSITDVGSRGLYQPPNSIRLDYGSSPSTAMIWFLSLL